MLRSLLTSFCNLRLTVSHGSARPTLLASRCFGVDQTRFYGTIFGGKSLDADQLWVGVTGAPGQKKKRARGKRRVTRPKVNLRKGMKIGMGSSKLEIPALLRHPVAKDGTIPKIREGTLDIEEYKKKLLFHRSQQGGKTGFNRLKLPPLLRGWTSDTMSGRSEGPPDRVMDCEFFGFDTKIIELKMVSHMTKLKGRTPTVTCFCVTGNGNGAGGYALGAANERLAAIKLAKNHAGQRVSYFKLRDNGRTLWHPAYQEMHHTKIFAYPARPGFGIRGNKLIVDICKLLGIKDIYVHIDGNERNYQVVTKAFFELLRNQENYQQLADKEHLHVVEFDEKTDGIPTVLASPSDGTTREVGREEDLDLSIYYFGGNVPCFPTKQLPGFLFHPHRLKRFHERHRFRNQWGAFLEREKNAHLHPEVKQVTRQVPVFHQGLNWSTILKFNMKKEDNS